ncbi:hypothetical protein Ami103574_14250 [Aminipila butyrica]|uniref:Uncharacterized protein n=1 Tax=Aminipila butyrica TaxID=433296 RepID=A0A858BZL7_9FIRM|nr:hypothetical protein [Aminipila butyrica]QIB70380.1 hypothetical protein Ami103574_14250 [Aminipila butyrica]
MENGVQRYLRAVVVVLITAFCAMKLPHQDKAIFDLLIPAIKLSPGSRLYLNGVLPLVLLLWSYKEIVKSNYFKSGKITIFLVMFFILVPFTFKAMDVIKIPYYVLSSGLKSIDVVESDYSFSNEPDGNTINIDLSLKNYGKEVKDLNVAIDLPKSLEKIIDTDPIALSEQYTVDKQHGILQIKESIPFKYKEGFSEEDLFNTYYFYDDYKIILSKADEKLTIIQKGR